MIDRHVQRGFRGEECERAMRELRVGVLVRVLSCPCRMFNEGDELLVCGVDVAGNRVDYAYPAGFVVHEENQVYPVSEMFEDGAVYFDVFCCPQESVWEVVPTKLVKGRQVPSGKIPTKSRT